jgi:hypothetical protein
VMHPPEMVKQVVYVRVGIKYARELKDHLLAIPSHPIPPFPSFRYARQLKDLLYNTLGSETQKVCKPYVELWLAGNRMRTQRLGDMRDPEWFSEFWLPLHVFDGRSFGQHLALRLRDANWARADFTVYKWVLDIDPVLNLGHDRMEQKWLHAYGLNYAARGEQSSFLSTMRKAVTLGASTSAATEALQKKEEEYHSEWQGRLLVSLKCEWYQTTIDPRYPCSLLLPSVLTIPGPDTRASVCRPDNRGRYSLGGDKRELDERPRVRKMDEVETEERPAEVDYEAHMAVLCGVGFQHLEHGSPTPHTLTSTHPHLAARACMAHTASSRVSHAARTLSACRRMRHCAPVAQERARCRWESTSSARKALPHGAVVPRRKGCAWAPRRRTRRPPTPPTMRTRRV